MVARYAHTEANGSAANRRSGPDSGGGSPSGWLLFFIGCACMFVLGVVVGRNTAPVNFNLENLDKKLNQLESSVLAEAGTAGDASGPETLNNIPFEFYDILRENPTAQTRETGGPTPLKRPRFEKKTSPEVAVALADLKKANTGTSDTPAVITPAENLSEQTQPPDSPEPSRPAPEAPAAMGPGYAIQVASLRDMGKAETVRDRFRTKGYPAYTQQAVVEGKGQWHRVRLGPYADKIQAQNDLSRLQKAGVDAILFLTDAN